MDSRTGAGAAVLLGVQSAAVGHAAIERGTDDDHDIGFVDGVVASRWVGSGVNDQDIGAATSVAAPMCAPPPRRGEGADRGQTFGDIIVVGN